MRKRIYPQLWGEFHIQKAAASEAEGRWGRGYLLQRQQRTDRRLGSSNGGIPYYSDTELHLQTCPATTMASGLASVTCIPLTERRAALSHLVTTRYVTGSPTSPENPSLPPMWATDPSSTHVTACGELRPSWISKTQPTTLWVWKYNWTSGWLQ